MNINSVTLVGRLIKDPEVRQAGEVAVADMTLAVNRRYKKKEETTFIDVTVWGKTAEVAGQYLAKGAEVGVIGRLTQDNWETPEGQKRSKLKVTADSIELGKKADSGNSDAVASSDGDDDDAPF